MARTQTVGEEKFYARIDTSGEHHIWNGTSNHSYKGLTYKPQRLIWILTYGPVPKDKIIYITCDEPRCMNVKHLDVAFRGEMKKTRLLEMDNLGKIPLKKLTEENVLEIRELYSRGIVQSELAREFKVSQNQISLIVNRKQWKGI